MIKILKQRGKPKSLAQRIVFGIVFVLFAAYAFSMIYTGIFAVVSALKTHDEFVEFMFEWPKEWLFKNFIDAFELIKLNVGRGVTVDLWGMLYNSVWYTIGSTFLGIACSTTLAYVVSKYRFVGRNAIYTTSLVIMILPIVGSLPAQFKLIKGVLEIDNSPLLLITSCNGFGFNFIVLYGFFQSLSWSYAEAAFIDGASDFRTFLEVMLPQAMPAVTSLVILSAIGVWNDYQGPILYLNRMPTIAVGLYEFKTNAIYEMNLPALFAGLVISILPVLVLFIIFQETIMSNTVAGGLKG